MRAPDYLEAATVLLGLVYVVLAVRRSRMCWIFGGLSSVGIAWLASQSALPMQMALQIFYVGMSFYGFWRWSAERDVEGRVKVGWWPLRYHAMAWAAITALTWATFHWAKAYTSAAQPLLDAACTWASLFATWLAARALIENWLYWIVIDIALVYLFAVQGLVYIAALYLAYLIIASVGFFTWLRRT